jgi:mono/diheme cytochrome c family protein
MRPTRSSRGIAARLLIGLAASLPLATMEAATKDKPGTPTTIDFNRDIRSLLSDNCFACHGPDDKERKARLRLDIRADALMPAKSGERAIVPGDASKSELMARITAKDADDIMPPPKTGKKLTEHQIELLRRWVQEGAKFEGHWAFTRPEHSELPAVKHARWPRNEIDRFVLARLEVQTLPPSPAADPVT